MEQVKEEVARRKYVKKTIGADDYERLGSINEEVIASLRMPDDKYTNLIIELNKLIKEENLLLMDKETGAAFTCSGLIGYVGNKLMLFNER